MATWIAHLRIAEKMLETLKNYSIEETAFIVGNIAPDSGVTSDADPSKFVPDKKTSHFTNKGKDGKTTYEYKNFYKKYLAPELRCSYDKKQLSFYLGYLTHLLTDVAWSSFLMPMLIENDRENYIVSPVETAWKWKKDWYDLDKLFLRDHENFRAFEIYKNAVGFKNDYIDFFPENAFDLKRKSIIGFYSNFPDDLDREYIWLTKEQLDTFTEKTPEFIFEKLKDIFSNK